MRFRRRESNDMVTPALNIDRLASAQRELSVSQSRLAETARIEERLDRLGVTPDEYGRAIARGYQRRDA